MGGVFIFGSASTDLRAVLLGSGFLFCQLSQQWPIFLQSKVVQCLGFQWCEPSQFRVFPVTMPDVHNRSVLHVGQMCEGQFSLRFDGLDSKVAANVDHAGEAQQCAG